MTHTCDLKRNQQAIDGSKITATTEQSLQLSRFDDQSHHDKTDLSETSIQSIQSSDEDSSLDYEDDYRSGTRNVSHQQQSF